MINNIQFSYPQYFLIFAVIVALLYALAMYFRSHKLKEAKSWLPSVLSFFRFSSILGILLLLLNPFIKQLTESQKDPIVVIAEDRSESIKAGLSDTELSEYLKQMDGLIEALGSKYEVKHISFGEQVRNVVKDSFLDQTSNIFEALESIDERFGDQNLGAVVLASDGIFNEGKNPVYNQLSFKAPIYSVALGDTTIKKDLFISNLLHNRIAYLADKFTVQIDVQAFNSAGSSSQLKLYKINGDKKALISQKAVSIKNNNFFKTYTFEVNASEAGNVKYRAELSKISDESSTVNNRKQFYMEILDARQRILLIANAPHPDIGALRKAITANKNYELELKYAYQDISNLASKDMIILHDLPSDNYPISTLSEQAKQKNIPLLFILGSQISNVRFNSMQDALKIDGTNGSQNDAQAIFAPGFNLYKIDDMVKSRVRNFVPLKAPFGEYKIHPKANVLLYQKIGTVDTKYPLACFYEQQNHKIGIIAGEGIWHWRLFEYAQHETHETTDEFISRMIQFISQKEDKRKFRAFASQNTYKENEQIFFDAQLYNQNYELVNDPDAFLTVKDSKGKKFDYTLSKSNNYYKLDAGRFPEGNYSFTATTKQNGQQYSASGKFVVQSIEKEQYDLTARHDILYSLSNKNNGQLYQLDQINNLKEALVNSDTIKPLLIQSSQTERLLNIKWLALVIAFLLFLEWFLRRFHGTY